MAYCWKTEYAVHDEDGDEFAWLDDLESAIACARESRGVKVAQVDHLGHFQIEYTDVWEKDE